MGKEEAARRERIKREAQRIRDLRELGLEPRERKIEELDLMAIK